MLRSSENCGSHGSEEVTCLPRSYDAQCYRCLSKETSIVLGRHTTVYKLITYHICMLFI
jgi:hypothetical protein